VISSYCGEFSISATCCRSMMPDPDFYRQCLLDSFEALKKSTLGKAAAKPRAKAKAKTKTRAKAKARPKAASRKSAPKQKRTA